jgi:hypothetical protein
MIAIPIRILRAVPFRVKLKETLLYIYFERPRGLSAYDSTVNIGACEKFVYSKVSIPYQQGLHTLFM